MDAHKCDDMPEGALIYHNIFGMIVVGDHGECLTNISHCPWCGEKLDRNKEE